MNNPTPANSKHLTQTPSQLGNSSCDSELTGISISWRSWGCRTLSQFSCTTDLLKEGNAKDPKACLQKLFQGQDSFPACSRLCLWPQGLTSVLALAPCIPFLNPCPDSSPKGRPNSSSCSLHTSCRSCNPEVVTPSHRDPGNPAKPTFNPITQTGKSDRLLQSGGLSGDHKSKAYPKPPLAQRLGPAASCGKNIPEGQPTSNCRWSFRPSDCQ